MPIAYVIDCARRRLFATVEGLVNYAEIVDHLGKERDDEGLCLHELIEAEDTTPALSTAKPVSSSTDCAN